MADYQFLPSHADKPSETLLEVLPQSICHAKGHPKKDFTNLTMKDEETYKKYAAPLLRPAGDPPEGWDDVPGRPRRQRPSVPNPRRHAAAGASQTKNTVKPPEGPIREKEQEAAEMGTSPASDGEVNTEKITPKKTTKWKRNRSTVVTINPGDPVPERNPAGENPLWLAPDYDYRPRVQLHHANKQTLLNLLGYLREIMAQYPVLQMEQLAHMAQEKERAANASNGKAPITTSNMFNFQVLCTYVAYVYSSGPFKWM